MVKPEKGGLGKRKPMPVDDYLGKKVDVRVNGKILVGVVESLAYELDRGRRVTTKLLVKLANAEKVKVKPSKAKPRSRE